MLSALLAYAFLLLVMLVLARGTRSTTSIIFDPFYTYRKILDRNYGSFEWLCLDVFNCLLFVPFGFFYTGWRQSGEKPLSRPLLHSAEAGFACSLLMETLQLLLRRGTFELGDLLHNTLGAAFGALLWSGATLLHSALKKEK